MLFSLDVRGSNLASIFMVWRALGGRKERKRRAVLALREKGLNEVLTEVMNLVIIFARFPADCRQFMNCRGFSSSFSLRTKSTWGAGLTYEEKNDFRGIEDLEPLR
jgi:hypothetical protein